MRYRVLAADYDGTIAQHGMVPDDVVESLKLLKASGRKLLLVTGRELDELKALFPQHILFDLIVAENGALLYDPATLLETPLGDPPPPAFVEELAKRGVQPLSAGRVIVATWEPHQATVLEVIKESGIERQIIFNKGAVMILPPGINKSKGLEAALDVLGYSLHNVVAVGDAENDTAMLQSAECAVSVANALPALREISDWVTPSDHGDGVAELIAHIRENDLLDLEPALQRHYLNLGDRFDNTPFELSPYGSSIVIAGASGGGKTTLTAAFMEVLLQHGYQFCMVDPEGDYVELQGAVTIGDAHQPPAIEALMQLLEQPRQSVVACTLALSMDEKPVFLQRLLVAVQELQQRKSRPHWLLLDEAHHLAPEAADPNTFATLTALRNFMAITTRPELLHRPLLEQTTTVIAVGEDPAGTLRNFADSIGEKMPPIPDTVLQKGEAMVWRRLPGETPFLVRTAVPQQVLQRHKRKYSSGDMGPDSFIFTGPENKLQLKASNLQTFTELSQGVDDDTWIYHLERKDYSNWVRNNVNDDALAEKIEKIETAEHDPIRSRAEIIKLIQLHYTGPA
ncbi:HAD hydrolase family protein [Chitinophaga sp. GCM10012297]|uniref:HAD hydrolase family protein n=1 Tax=Chitinophaga chungangae TaxID=2821488 RepID=A0ABS3YL07_9BACT|nr:HAD hydrolase family protein [Chitinophaga chungangae]MBO9155355.1 HAD hydrolase family protein [Chitinophaga chungangae]